MSDKALVQTLDTSAATRAAAANYSANRAALADHQPDLVLGEMPRRDWALARDGSLNCRIDGRWLAGCSVPADAAKLQFDRLEHGKPFVGLPDPLTAHHVAAALTTLKPGEAIFAHFPDNDALDTALCMVDFAADLRGGRLWLATGADWIDQLERIGTDHPGLPVLGEFIRQPQHGDRFYEDVVAEVSPVVRRIAERSAALVAERRTNAERDGIVVIAGTAWRTEDDAGHTLAAAIPGTHVDPDQPNQASRIAVQLATADAESIVAANLYRTDIPEAAEANQGWLTWHTRGPIRPRVNPIDRLLVADSADLDAARDAGWDNAAVAGWPSLGLPAPTGRRVALLADVSVTDEMPDEVERYSGQRPLWEAVAHYLDADPFATDGDPFGFVDRLATRIGVQRFARELLVETWVMPRVLRGVVGTLRGAGIDVRVIAPESRDEWIAEASAAAVLLDPSPTPRRSQLHATARPVLACTAARAGDLIASAQRLLKSTPPESAEPHLSAELVRQTLAGR
ncbi:MAG: hypothetical protein AAGD32_12800 [Planctomycetota bacterium]